MTSTSEIADPGPQAVERALDRRLRVRVEGRGRLVEKQHRRLERQRPGEHHPLLLADREPGRATLGEVGVEAGEVEEPLDVRLAPGELGGEAEVVLDRALEQRRELRDQADLAPQLERVELAARRGPVEDGARVGVGEPIEQAQRPWTCPTPRARRSRSPPPGAGRSASAAPGSPARESCTRSSSKSMLRLSGHRPASSDPDRPRADARHPRRRATGRGRLGLRGQVGRRPGAADRRPRRGPDHAPGRRRRDRALPGAGDAAARPARASRGPRRGDRRLRRAGAAQLPAPAAADGARPRGTIRARAAETPVAFVAFDLLWLDGRSLCDEPYEERRRLLAGLGVEDGKLAGAAPPRRRRVGAVAGRARARPRGRSSPSASAAPTGPDSAAASGSRSETARGQELRDRRLDARVGQPRRPGRLVARRHCDRSPAEARAAASASASSTRAASAPGSPRRRSTASPRWSSRSGATNARSSSARTHAASRAARPRPGRGAGLGRAPARLRGRVHRVDPRGHPAPAVVQGAARRQGPARESCERPDGARAPATQDRVRRQRAGGLRR